FSRNRSGMDLDELTVGVEGSLLVKGGLRRSRADHRVRGLAEDGADTPGRDDDRVSRKSTYFHGAEIHGADSAAGAVGVEHHGEEFPMFVLQDLAVRFMTAHLLVEGIQQLLTGGCPGKRRPVVQRSSKAAKIEQALRSTVKGDAHPVKQINDAGRGIAHFLHRRLIREEVAPVNRIVKMLPRGVAFAFQVLGGIDTALRAY